RIKSFRKKFPDIVPVETDFVPQYFLHDVGHFANGPICTQQVSCFLVHNFRNAVNRRSHYRYSKRLGLHHGHGKSFRLTKRNDACNIMSLIKGKNIPIRHKSTQLNVDVPGKYSSNVLNLSQFRAVAEVNPCKRDTYGSK